MIPDEQTEPSVIKETSESSGPPSAKEESAPTKEPPIPKSSPGSKYLPEIRKQQRFEAWALSVVLLILMILCFLLWRLSEVWWSRLVLAGSAGIIAGLVHSLKWFYRTIGDGEWELDRRWWRFLNPLVSGVIGLSIYVVLRSSSEAKVGAQELPGKQEGFYAYSVGFLSGLFADNAMVKLRDIAYAIFGPTERWPASKPPGSATTKAGGGSSHG